MKIKGWDLSFFETGEWQAADERLKDLEKINRRIGSDGYNPGRKSLFRALQLVPEGAVKVAIIGQDPYPDPRHATGVAFSVPGDLPVSAWPPTLSTILKEYNSDLHFPIPSVGSLDRWSERGVLLWNAIPSCLPGRSLSHDWPEWRCLTEQIIHRLSERGITFALLGMVARSYLGSIDLRNNSVVVTSHPSPRGSMNSKTPFTGSRIFSTINDKLVNNGQEPINWDLGAKDGEGKAVPR